MNNIPAPRPPVRLRPAIKGLDFVRIAIATAVAKANPSKAAVIAEQRWGDGSLPHRVLSAGDLGEMFRQKEAVEGGATLTGNWAEPLLGLQGAADEFFSLVRERSLIGRIAGLRRVPIRTRLIGLIEGFSAAWVGEGSAKPVGKATFAEEELPSRKVSALGVFSNELLQSLDPRAELLIRDDMAKALSAVMDASFIDPSNAGTPDLEPASVTNGAPSTAASGDGAADIRELIAAFPGDLERAILVGSPATFAVLSDPFLFPALGVRGGEALGIPAIPSSAAADTLALIDPDAIALGDGGTAVRVATQATVEMTDAPTGSSVTPTATSQVSLWQANATGVLVEQVVNWQPIRPCASVVTGMAAS
jgi:HK97 family phage major capsid protein